MTLFNVWIKPKKLLNNILNDKNHDFNKYYWVIILYIILLILLYYIFKLEPKNTEIILLIVMIPIIIGRSILYGFLILYAYSFSIKLLSKIFKTNLELKKIIIATSLSFIPLIYFVLLFLINIILQSFLKNNVVFFINVIVICLKLILLCWSSIILIINTNFLQNIKLYKTIITMIPILGLHILIGCFLISMTLRSIT